MTKREQRSKHEIIYEILVTIANGHERYTKTRIMQKTSLDWRTFKKYFSMLLEKGFIVKGHITGDYFLTPPGCELMSKIESILLQIGEENREGEQSDE